ncbi:minor capsid protein L2 [Human papillomavirus type 48]|uniref:Minor capsid protein L2 n=1 Tax=Human papillomavirus type 48 TaxID=40538 RepID=VL2_HPV48|nr:minor capsid protein L2 [Human papillomavirus type 48]Q80925.1 RecName: Full=Minor capsid protein L2 [Human papillomavirus type 48]AAA79469.1 minor capsid protein L2 [Human papillomavirus type 48]
MSLRRRKRASPTDLYKTCLQGGDCIPDVKNKFENSTIADWLLKIFGSLVYFGNLGIGSGKGSGGSFGYRPLGSAGSGRPATDLPVTRPNVVIEPIGPQSIVPIDPGASSIVPLVEGGPDISFIAPDAGPGIGGEDIELFTFRDPATDVGGVSGGPTTISTEESETAIIDALPSATTPKQLFYDSYTQTILQTQVNPFLNNAISDTNVFVDPLFAGETIGDNIFEEIPLQNLNFSFPRESTPVKPGRGLRTPAQRSYSRFMEQYPIQAPEFLSQPSRLVQFEFENPAFDPDISIQFQRDVNSLEAAPNPAFADIAYLSRPHMSATSEGLVRVSRIGSRAVLQTRSGLTIGPKVHYYMDLSAISTEAIELQTFADSGHVHTIVDDFLSVTALDDPANIADINYTEDDLLDPLLENFNNSHITVQGVDEEGETVALPIPSITNSSKTFVTDIAENGLFANDTDSLLTPASTIVPAINWFPLFDSYSDFALDPFFIPRKKRRLDIL